MNIYFGIDVQYPFEQLNIKKDQTALYILSLVLVIVYQVLGQYLASFKTVYISKNTNLFYQTAFNFLIFTHRVFAMLLLMTTNGGVIICVLLGQFLGYLIFNSKFVRKESPIDLQNRTCC